MQRSRARRDDPPAILGWLSVPSGDDATGTLDDRDQRHDVIGLETGFDHEIDLSAASIA